MGTTPWANMGIGPMCFPQLSQFGSMPPWNTAWPRLLNQGCMGQGPPAGVAAAAAPAPNGGATPPAPASDRGAETDPNQKYRRILKSLLSGAWPRKLEVLGLAASYPPKPQRALYQNKRQVKDHKHRGQEEAFGFYIMREGDPDTKVHVYLDSGKVWVEGPKRDETLKMILAWTSEGKPQPSRPKKKAKRSGGTEPVNFDPAEATRHLMAVLHGNRM
jgi:hypothetical protein